MCLRLQTDTIPQTDYDIYDNYSDYNDLRAQAWWIIEAATDKSSDNNKLAKTLAMQANGDSRRISNGEMQHLRVLIKCGASSIFMTPRLLKWLRRSHQAANITILAMTRGVIPPALDSRKTRITVQCMDYLALVCRSDVLVVPIRAFDWVLCLPWFAKPNFDIEWAQLTPWDHLVRVERRNDTDEYGSAIEGIRSQKWSSAVVRPRYPDTWSNRIRQSSNLHCSPRSICPTDWGMHRAAGSDFGRHHLGYTRWYRPKRWTRWAESSGGSCGR